MNTLHAAARAAGGYPAQAHMKRRTRRWGHILFNTLTAISLLLALATAGLWVRSTRYVDRYALKHTSAETLSVWGYTQGFGSLNLMKYTYTSAEPKLREGFAPDAGYSNESIHRFPLVERLFPPGTGFEFIDKSDQAPRMVTRFHSIEVPHWFLLLACSMPPAARGIAAIRRRFRDSRGHCPACGYDIRANPEKCSECGREIATGG